MEATRVTRNTGRSWKKIIGNHEVLNLIVMWFSQKEMGRELGLMSPREGCTCSFAAELFQGFHKEMKEVLGQNQRLKARVLRLEAELPLVEKEFLSETNQTHYSYS